MICLVRDMVTDEPKAIHRTALGPDGLIVEIGGNKRLSYGPTSGGAIKITSQASVRCEIGIAEGIETTLSLRHLGAFGDRAVWSLLTAETLRAAPFEGRTKTLDSGGS